MLLSFQPFPKQARYQTALRPDKIKTTFIIWNKKNQDQSCRSARPIILKWSQTLHGRGLGLSMGRGNFLDTTMKTGYLNKLCVKCLCHVMNQLGYNYYFLKVR
jgi:hypothetical protein